MIREVLGPIALSIISVPVADLTQPALGRREFVKGSRNVLLAPAALLCGLYEMKVKFKMKGEDLQVLQRLSKFGYKWTGWIVHHLEKILYNSFFRSSNRTVVVCLSLVHMMETVDQLSASSVQYSVHSHCYSEPEFLNIYWRLRSRLFEENCLFKGQSVQQGSQWLQFFCVVLSRLFNVNSLKKTKKQVK